jgi:hypothetical protein
MPQTAARVVTTDIDNFWTAYDKVITTKDRSEQLSYLNKLFIEKGTQGLRAMMQAEDILRKSISMRSIIDVNTGHRSGRIP